MAKTELDKDKKFWRKIYAIKIANGTDRYEAERAANYALIDYKTKFEE